MFTALKAAAGIIPGWAYALAIAVLLLVVGAGRIEVANAERDGAVATAQLQGDRAAAQAGLARQTALVLKATNELNAARAAQEKRDGDAQATIAALGEDLRRRGRAGGGGGLRDPNAPACRGGSDAGPGAAAVAGGEDPAAAGGLLSEPMERLLLETIAEADTINIAYASCREDALKLRASIRSLSPPPGPASTGSP